MFLNEDPRGQRLDGVIVEHRYGRLDNDGTGVELAHGDRRLLRTSAASVEGGAERRPRTISALIVPFVTEPRG